MTHAIFNGNLDMIKFLFENCHANSKKIVRVPGLYSTNEVSKLFPFFVALATGNEEMFDYFWTHQKKLNWTEDAFETLFTLLAKREASHIIQLLFRSRTTHSMFQAMTYSYRDVFMERILSIEDELLDELALMVREYKGDDRTSSVNKLGSANSRWASANYHPNAKTKHKKGSNQND